MSELSVSVIMTDKKIFEGKVQEIVVPGQEGGMEIFPNHAPLLAALKKGKIVVKGESEEEFEIESGFIEVHNNVATILAR